MGTSEPSNALRRLTTAGRAHHQARAITLQKGMRIALARVADEAFDLPMAMIGATLKTVLGDDIKEVLNDDALILHLDGPARAKGAALVDQSLVGAMIQQQTLGKVLEFDNSTRPMTNTDAAMCAPLVDKLIEAVTPMLDSDEERRLIERFQFGYKAEDVRTLVIGLTAHEYEVLQLTIDIAQGARQGEMTLIFPKVAAEDVPLDEVEAPQEGAKPVQMVDAVMAVEAVVEMVVCQLPMSLEAVRGLKAGDVLALPPGGFPSVQMVTRTGRVVGRGTVGHVNGVRAVKPVRKPRQSDQPLRRAADAGAVDGPDFTPPERREADANLPALAEPALHAPDLPAPDLPELDSIADPPDLPTLDDLDLPDLPLSDAPDAPALPDAASAPAEVDLPALEDFPDLADLPDLSDLPDLATG